MEGKVLRPESGNIIVDVTAINANDDQAMSSSSSATSTSSASASASSAASGSVSAPSNLKVRGAYHA